MIGQIGAGGVVDESVTRLQESSPKVEIALHAIDIGLVVGRQCSRIQIVPACKDRQVETAAAPSATATPRMPGGCSPSDRVLHPDPVLEQQGNASQCDRQRARCRISGQLLIHGSQITGEVQIVEVLIECVEKLPLIVIEFDTSVVVVPIQRSPKRVQPLCRSQLEIAIEVQPVSDYQLIITQLIVVGISQPVV